MALLKNSIEDKKLDVRVKEMNVTRGKVTQKDAESTLSSLPDDAENGDWVSIEDILTGSEETLSRPRPNRHVSFTA